MALDAAALTARPCDAARASRAAHPGGRTRALGLSVAGCARLGLALALAVDHVPTADRASLRLAPGREARIIR